ncbi:MAG: flagellar hook-length control protein FliK [Phycisphaeraceae bacterium]|nr:MAG: flagellar hook-length control protein FliK [Phycisphaeraceae bacterium]
MRIEASNQPTRSAPAAPAKQRADAAVTFMGMLSSFDDPGTGPDGAASLAKKQLTDPLGLATKQAMVSPADGPVSGARTADRAPAAPEPADASGASLQAKGDAEPLEPRSVPKSGSVRTPESTAPSVPSDRPTVDTASRQGTPSGGVRAAAPRSSLTGADASRLTVAAPKAEPGTRETGGGSVAARSGSHGGKSLAGLTNGVVKSEVLKAGAKPTVRQPILREEKAEIAPQIEKGLATLLKQKGGRVQIQLRPEALGRVSVDLTIEQGVVHATLDAEHESARQLLHSELDRLRSMLEHRGLRVERLEIASHEGEQEAQPNRDGDRGGWRTPAQDGHRGVGTEADGRSPGGGDQRRAWVGDPGGRAERRRPGGQAIAAEAGVMPMDGDPYTRRSPVAMSIRLDTVA